MLQLISDSSAGEVMQIPLVLPSKYLEILGAEDETRMLGVVNEGKSAISTWLDL